MNRDELLLDAIERLRSAISGAPELAPRATALLSDLLAGSALRVLPPVRACRVVRLADLERKLSDRSPSDRLSIIRTQMGISRAHYYSLLDDAKAVGLL